MKFTNSTAISSTSSGGNASVHREYGVTLIELLIVIVIIGILAALAAPAYTDFVDRQRLLAASEDILSDVRWAKGEAIKRNSDVEIDFTDGANWGYVISDSSGAILSVSGAIHPQISLNASISGKSFSFDNIRGLTTPIQSKELILTTDLGRQATVKVGAMGKARICGLQGYDPC